MASGARTSLLDIFLFLFFLLSLHLGCCFSPSRSQDDPDPQHARPKRRKISPLSPSPPASDPDSDSGDARPDRNGGLGLGLGLSLTSVRSYLRRFFSVPKRGGREDIRSPPVDLSPCPCPCPRIAADKSPSSGSAGISAADCPCPPGTKHTSFASRADVFACSACGEVLTKPHLLELHQATKHSLSELSDADSGKNIVRIIFLSGWKGRAPPTVRRILKVHNTQRTLARFEEYRDLVRSRAARRGGGAEFERCIADGNERLRFYCSTMLCSLGGGACGSPYCCTCGIVRHGFAGSRPTWTASPRTPPAGAPTPRCPTTWSASSPTCARAGRCWSAGWWRAGWRAARARARTSNWKPRRRGRAGRSTRWRRGTSSCWCSIPGLCCRAS
uniref:C2H2-type domain-containing protein n=1 Tax=Ananas comosus var. bracteatus TaxID=296719 RepID=A0A6V7QVL4_ANACO